MVGLREILVICGVGVGLVLGFAWGLYDGWLIAVGGAVASVIGGGVLGFLFYEAAERVARVTERLSPRSPLLWLIVVSTTAVVAAGGYGLLKLLAIFLGRIR